MSPEADNSVSRWIVGAKAGESAAVRSLWQRYYQQLVRLARQKLAGTSRRAADEEDVALSAFASFCRAAEEGRFPDLAGRDDLWRLLMRLTARKAVDQARHEGTAKRGGGRVRGESVLAQGDLSWAEEGLAQVIGETPTPEFAAIMAEECSRLLGQLNDDLRAVVVAKMEDYTNQEIAEKLDCSAATIERRLRLIRSLWRHAPTK
jgi:DNA-directed RNA polymerase specialized sigma24 family protein